MHFNTQSQMFTQFAVPTIYQKFQYVISSLFFGAGGSPFMIQLRYRNQAVLNLTTILRIRRVSADLFGVFPVRQLNRFLFCTSGSLLQNDMNPEIRFAANDSSVQGKTSEGPCQPLSREYQNFRQHSYSDVVLPYSREIRPLSTLRRRFYFINLNFRRSKKPMTWFL